MPKVTVKDYRPKQSVVLEFPFGYPSKNITEYMRSWQKKKKLHDEFQGKVHKYLLSKRCPNFPNPVKILIDLYFPTKRKRDIANYSPNWLLDALHYSKVIVDDSTEFIPEAPDIKIISGETKQNKIVVQINEL